MRVCLIGVAVSFLALASAAHAQDEKTEKVGSWELISITDPITDEGRMIAGIQSDDGMLALKCDEPGPESVYVHWISSDYLGGDYDRRRTTIRFDQDQPTTETWSYEGRNAIQTSDRAAIAFARRLRSASRVVLRGTDFRGGEHTAIFELVPEDTNAALTRVFATCGAGAL